MLACHTSRIGLKKLPELHQNDAASQHCFDYDVKKVEKGTTKAE
jgi:hypothetical protein